MLKPRVSEKSYGLSQTLNTYVFDVDYGVSRQAIALEVTKQYGVAVISVRTAAVPGKAKRAQQGKRRVVKAQRSDIRKAYVTLKEGDSLPFFADVDAERAKETK